jgi:beta-lactamase regulating signal transducer with metallopeptidase domain
MAVNPKVKNPLILSIVSTVFLFPILVLVRYIFKSYLAAVPNGIVWAMIVVATVIYYIIIFLVFLYYGSLGKK